MILYSICRYCSVFAVFYTLYSMILYSIPIPSTSSRDTPSLRLFLVFSHLTSSLKVQTLDRLQTPPKCRAIRTVRTMSAKASLNHSTMTKQLHLLHTLLHPLLHQYSFLHYERIQYLYIVMSSVSF